MRAARVAPVPLYDADFAQWCAEQAEALRAGRLDGLDLANLAEEIESMGKSQRRELESRLAVILLHMLKLDHQPGKATRSWHGSISREQGEIGRILRDSPSLRNAVPAAVADAYRDARRTAAAETGIALKTFPATCPYAVAQVLPDLDAG